MALSAELELRLVVDDLLARYVRAIDDDKLETWPDFFSPDAVYKIVSTENYERDLPVGVMLCNGQGMMRDRVASIRRANIFEPHRYKHLVSSTTLERLSDTEIEAVSNYQVVRINQDGNTYLFSVGRYVDRIDLSGSPVFTRKLVIFDNERIDTLLAIPL